MALKQTENSSRGRSDLVFLKGEENFFQDKKKKVSRRNDKRLSTASFEFLNVIKTKFSAAITVLRLFSNEGDITSPYFSPQSPRVKHVADIEVLEAIVKRRVNSVWNGRLYVFSKPLHYQA